MNMLKTNATSKSKLLTSVMLGVTYPDEQHRESYPKTRQLYKSTVGPES